ncbi:MAG: T9SS type A sorting domain-containing protein [Bacteroidales bacterium]
MTLNAGFSAEAGSTFSATVNSTSGTSLKSAITDNSIDSSMTVNTITDIENEKISNIQVYPNPNSGSFIIDFGLNNCHDFDLKIIDINGKLVYSEDRIELSTMEVNGK